MNQELRAGMVPIAIGVAACVVATQLLLMPARRALEQARAEHAAMTASDSTPQSDDATRRAEELSRVNAETEERVRRASAAARDESALFAIVMDLAERDSMQVEQFQPIQTPLVKPVAPGQPEPPKADVVTSYSLTMTGGFFGVVRFLDGLCSAETFHRVRGVRIVPLGGNDTPGAARPVRAELTLDFFAFSTRANERVTRAEVAP